MIIPEGVVEIESGSFIGTSLTSFYFPKSLRVIGVEAFNETNLVEVNFNTELELNIYDENNSVCGHNALVLENGCFADCKSLQKVIGSNIVVYGRCF